MSMRPLFWSSGGALVAFGGVALSRAKARRIRALCLAEAARGDSAAAKLARDLAGQIDHALEAAELWRRAAGPARI